MGILLSSWYFLHFEATQNLKWQKSWQYDQLIFQFNKWQVINYVAYKVYGIQNISRTSTAIIYWGAKETLTTVTGEKLLFIATESYSQLLWTFCLTFQFHTLLWPRVLCLLRTKRRNATWLCKYSPLPGLPSASTRKPSIFIARLLLMACPCYYKLPVEFQELIMLSCLSVRNNDTFICFK